MAAGLNLNVISLSNKAVKFVVKFELPDAKSGCKYLEPENMDELVELLQQQSYIICQ